MMTGSRTIREMKALKNDDTEKCTQGLHDSLTFCVKIRARPMNNAIFISMLNEKESCLKCAQKKAS